MIPYGLQRRLPRAPFESHPHRAVPAGEVGEVSEVGEPRPPWLLDAIPEDDRQVEVIAR